MKKLLFLFTTLLLISCSSDEDSSSSDYSEIVGTYSFVVGCDSTCDDDDLWYGYDCPTDYLEFTDTLFLTGFIDTDDCSDTNYLEEISVSYEITKTDSQEIHGKINFNGLDPDYENDYFVCLHRFSRVIDDEVFFSLMTAVSYKDGKVITLETIREPLDEDPSEGQDWNWEDYR